MQPLKKKPMQTAPIIENIIPICEARYTGNEAARANIGLLHIVAKQNRICLKRNFVRAKKILERSVICNQDVRFNNI